MHNYFIKLITKNLKIKWHIVNFHFTYLDIKYERSSTQIRSSVHNGYVGVQSSS